MHIVFIRRSRFWDKTSRPDVVLFGAKKQTAHRSKTKTFNGEYELHITVNWQYNAWKCIRLSQPGNEPKDRQGQTRSSSMYEIWVGAYLWKYFRKILKNVYILTMSLSMHYRFEQEKYVELTYLNFVTFTVTFKALYLNVPTLQAKGRTQDSLARPTKIKSDMMRFNWWECLFTLKTYHAKLKPRLIKQVLRY